jgi:hypothetical protein
VDGRYNTFAELLKELHVTYERVRHLQEKAIRRIKIKLRKPVSDPYIYNWFSIMYTSTGKSIHNTFYRGYVQPSESPLRVTKKPPAHHRGPIAVWWRRGRVELPI